MAFKLVYILLALCWLVLLTLVGTAGVILAQSPQLWLRNMFAEQNVRFGGWLNTWTPSITFEPANHEESPSQHPTTPTSSSISPGGFISEPTSNQRLSNRPPPRVMLPPPDNDRHIIHQTLVAATETATTLAEKDSSGQRFDNF